MNWAASSFVLCTVRTTQLIWNFSSVQFCHFVHPLNLATNCFDDDKVFGFWHSTDSKLLSALQRAQELEQANTELVSEVQLMSQRQAEHLEFSSRLTETNGRLQADNSHLSAKVSFASLSTYKQSWDIWAYTPKTTRFFLELNPPQKKTH